MNMYMMNAGDKYVPIFTKNELYKITTDKHIIVAVDDDNNKTVIIDILHKDTYRSISPVSSQFSEIYS